MTRRGRLLAACSALTLLAGVLALSNPQDQQRPRPLAIESLAGRDNFDRYCAPCHGADAHGNGPAAKGLIRQPPDLTVLARANQGTFPSERLVTYVRGSEHGRTPGSGDMPSWGPLFMGLDPSDARTTQRIANMVAYLESLQVPSTGEEDPGARLYRAHCASCHGADGRGMGPVADVRHPMPDLTKFAARNGGVFPSARVYRVIDGRDVGAHGSPEMPVWGSQFQRRDGADAAAVKARIDAIVKYLEGIQQRAS